jgi:hypothetical protein
MDETVEDLSTDRDAKQAFDAETREKSRALDKKREAIERACQEKDVKALVGYATSPGGLLDDTLRQAACMFLLHSIDLWLCIDFLGPLLLGEDQSKEVSQIDWTDLPQHGDEDQVKLDVNRSFVYYPQGLFLGHIAKSFF